MVQGERIFLFMGLTCSRHRVAGARAVQVHVYYEMRWNYVGDDRILDAIYFIRYTFKWEYLRRSSSQSILSSLLLK